MFNIYNRKSRRKLTAIIAIILVLAMVVPLALSYLV